METDALAPSKGMETAGIASQPLASSNGDVSVAALAAAAEAACKVQYLIFASMRSRVLQRSYTSLWKNMIAYRKRVCVKPEGHHTLYQHIRRPRDLLDRAGLLCSGVDLLRLHTQWL